MNTICGDSTFDPLVKGNHEAFIKNVYSSSVITGSNSSKQKKRSVMTLYLITTVFGITCFAIVSYALPVADENDAAVSFFHLYTLSSGKMDIAVIFLHILCFFKIQKGIVARRLLIYY